MDGLKLNLGTFNECVDHVPGRRNVEYPTDVETEVFYYMSENGDIVSTKLAYNQIGIPMFNVGGFAEGGRIDDSDVVKRLLSSIELSIFAMLKRILKQSNSNSTLENIRIPIGHVQIFDDNNSDGCYGWADVGIAVFKKGLVKNECKV